MKSTDGAVRLYRKDPCNGLRDRKWGEVVADQTVRTQLKKCLKTDVFRLKRFLSFGDETRISLTLTCISLTLTSAFFHMRQFYRARVHLPPPSKRKPNKKRVEKFYKKMLNIQREFDNAFLIDRRIKPSLTNLRMQLEFPLEGLASKEVEIKNIPVRKILKYLRSLWLSILNQKTLLEDGYDFRPSL